MPSRSRAPASGVSGAPPGNGDEALELSFEGSELCGEEAACGGGEQDLSSFDEAERLQFLAALTARFSATYLRWMRMRPGVSLTYSNVRVLEILVSEGPTIMRDIATSLGLTARNMTAIIDALEEGGLVRRTPHPHDRRATVVELTPVGREEAGRARRESVARVADAFNTMTVDEQQQYAALLRRLGGFFCR
jgi:DNA-binding MarR family transcriptional regulator